MGMLFDLLVIASIVVWVLGLAARGVLDPNFAIYAIGGLVILIAIGRRIGSRLSRLVLRVGLPIASLWTFGLLFGVDNLAANFGMLALLLIMLAGLYIMVRGRVW